MTLPKQVVVTRPGSDLSNPVVVYTGVWALVVALTSLRLTTNLLPLNASTLLLIAANGVSMWVLYLLVGSAIYRRGARGGGDISAPILGRLVRFVNRLLVFWAGGIGLTVFYNNGLPLTWALQGSAKTYADFGIPTFHGLLNAIYFFSVTALLLDYLVCKHRRSLFLLLLLLLWPVVAFARSVLVGVACQMAGVFLVLYRVSLRNLVRFAAVGLSLIILFGLIGDYRGSESNWIALVDDRYGHVFRQLPSGFLWGYIYLTAPLNNIVANIETLEPTYVPYYSIANLVPTVWRPWLTGPDFVRPDGLRLVDENLNVSTVYAGYLSDFGVLGSILSVALLQLFTIVVYFKARRKEVWGIMAYGVFYQCLVFSVFYNLLASQVYVLQILIALLFARTVKRLRPAEPHRLFSPKAAGERQRLAVPSE